MLSTLGALHLHVLRCACLVFTGASSPRQADCVAAFILVTGHPCVPSHQHHERHNPYLHLSLFHPSSFIAVAWNTGDRRQSAPVCHRRMEVAWPPCGTTCSHICATSAPLPHQCPHGCMCGRMHGSRHNSMHLVHCGSTLSHGPSPHTPGAHMSTTGFIFL